MMADDPLVAGIDVAASRPCVGVALRPAPGGGRIEAVAWHESIPATEAHEQTGGRGGRRRSAGPGAPPDLLDWLDGLSPSPSVVAIDAPQGYNRRLLARRRADPRRSRVCDDELLRRRLGVYQVPSRADVAADPRRLPSWMAVGFDLYAQLRRRGFEAPDQGALPGAFGRPPALLEVYPYATFVAVLGRRLSRKTTREGLRLRVAALRSEGVVWDRGGPERTWERDAYYDHDSLDALAAALTAWRFVQGVAGRLGDPREGLIWLPVGEERFAESLSPSPTSRGADG